MMQIHLIRHGATMANEQKLYCGTTDLALSEAGKAELMSLCEQGVYPKGKRVGERVGEQAKIYITSGFLRTEQTMELLYGAVCREILPQLAEYDFGKFEMQGYEALKECSDYQAWIMDKSGAIACPGGERKQDFTRRVLQGFESVLGKVRAVNAEAFIVCHGGVIACIMEHMRPGVRNFYEWQPKPGRGYTLTYKFDKFRKYTEI